MIHVGKKTCLFLFFIFTNLHLNCISDECSWWFFEWELRNSTDSSIVNFVSTYKITIDDGKLTTDISNDSFSSTEGMLFGEFYINANSNDVNKIKPKVSLTLNYNNMKLLDTILSWDELNFQSGTTRSGYQNQMLSKKTFYIDIPDTL